MRLMLGNEALARGAWEAGVRVVSSYPGTPSTEITEYVSAYDDIYSEWAPNEKVALEVCAGASLGGARAMCCMKHVGLNVAADPLYTMSYTGVSGGVAIVVADDPGMHSSQNEQDSRFHARASLTPMLEPSDSQECLDFLMLAIELSERYDTPVLVRTTTRVSHARSRVITSDRVDAPLVDYKKDPMKFVMMPAMARARHVIVEARMERIATDANDWDINRVEAGDRRIGVIASGAAYNYVKEALPGASVLKLGLVNPLPLALIGEFASQVDKLYVIEELEPVIEEQVLAMGLHCAGKALTGRQGELSVKKIAAIMAAEGFGADIIAPELCGSAAENQSIPMPELPARPPVLCPGCPHRGAYAVIKKLRLCATGDIGCYTLGALPPLTALDSCLCMGASVSMAHGLDKARGAEFAAGTVAVIGDSTFVHSGITGLVNSVYNRGASTVLILDNGTTGMTGRQAHPSTGKNLHGQEAPRLDLEALCRACGVKHVCVVDPFDMEGLEAALKAASGRDEVSVVIARRLCTLLPESRAFRLAPLDVYDSKCLHCHACARLGCPAIESRQGAPYINPALCIGCGLCKSVCKFDAIGEAGKDA